MYRGIIRRGGKKARNAKRFIEEKYNHQCFWCSKPIRFFFDGQNHINDGASVDHIIPVCKGGRDSRDNYVLSCLFCNNERGHQSVFKYFRKKSRIKTHEYQATYRVFEDYFRTDSTTRNQEQAFVEFLRIKGVQAASRPEQSTPT